MFDHEQFRKLRKAKFKSLGEAGEASGMNGSHLGEIELGKKVPKLDTLWVLLRSYGYELEIYAVKAQGESRLSHRLF